MKETIVIKSTREGKYTRGKCYKIAFPHKVRKVEFYDKDKGEFAYELRFGGTLKAWRDSMTAAARNGDNDNLLPTGVVIDTGDVVTRVYYVPRDEFVGNGLNTPEKGARGRTIKGTLVTVARMGKVEKIVVDGEFPTMGALIAEKGLKFGAVLDVQVITEKRYFTEELAARYNVNVDGDDSTDSDDMDGQASE